LSFQLSTDSFRMKLAIIATHPIQYHIPWFRELSKQPDIELKVYFACIPDAVAQGSGFDVAFEWDIPMLEGYEWEVLENRKHPARIDGFFSSNVRNMGEVLKRDRPDAVILTGWQALPLLQALFWCVFLRIPRVVRGDSNGMKPRSWKVRLVHRFLLSLYDAFLVVGKANQRFYECYGITRKKLFSCPHFVENDRLLWQAEAIESERDALREGWGISTDAICFLYMGKLNHNKRLFDQVAALKLARKKNKNITLLVVGTGELMDEAKRMVEDEQLPVTFAGFLNQTEITQAYVAADCLVLSSYDEAWGLVVNEAMVCGLPAIVSDRVGSGPDLIEEGKTGLTYPFADVEALAEKMLFMAEDPKRMKDMGMGAKELVLRDYSVEKAVEGTLTAVERLKGKV